MKSTRRGFALVAVLAALATIEIAVLAVLLVCREAESSARDAAALARTRAAAEGALRHAVANWDESTLRSVPSFRPVQVPGAAGSLPGGVRYDVTAERWTRGLWWLRGEAVMSGGGAVRARSSIAVLATGIPLADFVADFQAALAAGGAITVTATGDMDATQAQALPHGWTAADCAALPPPNPSVMHPALALGPSATLANAGHIAGMPPVLTNAPRTDSTDFARLGPLPWAELATVADRKETGTLTLAPAANGAVCDTSAAGNWGAPLDPLHPCHDYFPLILSTGALHLQGGAGQGILAVDGALTIDAGAQFTGVILARTVDAAANARITGSVRSEKNAHISAILHYSECAVWRALERSPALRKLYRYGDRWWLAGWG